MIRKMIALDWRAMKYYQKRVLLLPVFVLIIGWQNALMIIPFSVMMFLSFSVNPFAVEEKGELNNLYLTLPIKRKTIVTGRYVLSLIMFIAGIAMGIALMLVSHHFSMSKWFIGFKGYMLVIAFSYLLYALSNLSMFPILFRLGYQKGKAWGFYLPVIVFALLFGVYTMISTMPGNEGLTIEFITFASENMLLVSGGIVIIASLALALSYSLAVRVYSKRDF
ncbi:MAG: ABC-2 transporter permease [Bacillota bacterium]|jgi:hypothetical protein|nr:ABC-2 transporter permease [Bacillota bacterium]